MDINRTCTPVHSSLFILSRFWDSAKSGWVMGKRDKNFNRWCWWDNFVTVDCLWDKNEINHRDAWENFTLGSRLEIFVSYRALNWNFVCSTVGCMRVWKRRQIMQNKPVRCQRITDFHSEQEWISCCPINFTSKSVQFLRSSPTTDSRPICYLFLCALSTFYFNESYLIPLRMFPKRSL